MSNEPITRYTIEEIRDRRARAERTGETDWTKVDALSDAEIGEAMRSDPDWRDDPDPDWANATLVIPPGKTPISIRLDDDVLAFFKEGGPGYQKRINAVLRTYMGATLKRRARRRSDAAE
jgi:uncharacterized protein (DUF4415 family)